jgi:hypothetical protein
MALVAAMLLLSSWGLQDEPRPFKELPIVQADGMIPGKI